MMTLMIRFATPLMIEQPMDIAVMMAGMMGSRYETGMAIHIMLCILIFPPVYFTLFLFIPETVLVKNLLFGT